MPPHVSSQVSAQVAAQGQMHPALAASLPGLAALGGSTAGVAAAVPASAPAAPAVKPPVTGSPTFCLLVKNMFDPATETDEGWELDIKEEMEEVRELTFHILYKMLADFSGCSRFCSLCFVDLRRTVWIHGYQTKHL